MPYNSTLAFFKFILWDSMYVFTAFIPENIVGPNTNRSWNWSPHLNINETTHTHTEFSPRLILCCQHSSVCCCFCHHHILSLPRDTYISTRPRPLTGSQVCSSACPSSFGLVLPVLLWQFSLTVLHRPTTAKILTGAVQTRKQIKALGFTAQIF